jgi:hypothetical protein
MLSLREPLDVLARDVRDLITYRQPLSSLTALIMWQYFCSHAALVLSVLPGALSAGELAALPLAEDIPIAFNSCRKGPRGIDWRDDKPAEIYWAECQVQSTESCWLCTLPWLGRDGLESLENWPRKCFHAAGT